MGSLEKLAADSNYDVRCAVARNTSTPVGSLEKLAADSNYGVRCAVAENTSTPAETRATLPQVPAEQEDEDEE